MGPEHAIYLFPFGDMHTENKGFHDKGFKQFTDDVESRERALSFHIGDPTDLANRRTGRALKDIESVGGMEEIKNTIDEKAFAAQDKVIRLINPIKDTLQWSIIGNHSWPYFDTDTYGASTDVNISNALGSPMTTGLATTKIGLAVGSKSTSIRIMGRHGLGGASTETGDQNKLIKEIMQYVDVDIFVAGHTHHHYVRKLRPLYGFHGIYPISHNRHVGRTGTFKRNLLIDDPMHPSYEEQAGYSAAGLGYLRYKVWLKRKYRGKKDTIIPHIEGTAVSVD